MNTVILEIPDEQMQRLNHFAQQQGINVSTAIAELISYIPPYRNTGHIDIAQDPIYNIKSHETDAPPDLSYNADYYLYGADKQ